MENFIVEPQKQIPVSDTCDVLVAGGGVAGVAAALAAARRGKRVVLCEQQYIVGGLATAGLIAIYLPLCDGRGRQVSFSVAEELLRLSVCEGGGEVPALWQEPHTPEERAYCRFKLEYNPQLAAIAWEQALTAAGVRILYGTSVCAIDQADGMIRHVIVENKSGRSAIAVKSVIDATGDADVTALSGEETARFGQGNVLAAWYYSFTGGKPRMHMLGFSDIPDKYKTKEIENLLSPRRFGGLDAEERSEMVLDSHKTLLEDYRRFREKGDEALPMTIATIPQVRMTRRLAGDYTLDDTESFTRFEDSVGLISDWRKPGPVYEVPFGTLHGSRVKNLLTAGRCISVTDAMWDISRVIPCCAVTGEAAGVAASVGSDFTQINLAAVQDALRQNGVALHTDEIF